MDTKKLRQKILDLAIRGKLVPQDPNDEPASLLLKRIRAEKERLIAEGKIKRSKKSKATSRESHYQNFVPPFEIPDSWEWVRLEELVEFQGGYAYKSNTYVDSSNWQVVRIGNVKNDKLLLDSQPVFVPEQIGNDTIKYQIQSDDILFTMTGTKGKRDYFYSVKVPSTSTKLLLNQRVGCLRRIAKDLYIDYLCNVLKSTYILDTIFATETGNVSQGNIGSESTLSLYIPLPPYLEQERIVRTLNEFILTLYNIDNYTGDLQETIQNAKSKILDLAMQGNLVSQDPTDEPASDMLLRINPKAKIITDNPHYPQLPYNWVLTTIGSVCNYGDSDNVSVDGINSSDWVLELEDIEKDSGNIVAQKPKEERTIKGIRHRFVKGDVLYSKLRTYLNKVLVAPADGYCTTEIIPIKTYDCVIPEYLCAWLRSPFFLSYTAECCYGVKMPRLSTSDARKGIIPLPPTQEQRLIVQKLNEISESLEILSNSIH